MSRRRRSKAAAAMHAQRKAAERPPKPVKSKWRDFWWAIGIVAALVFGLFAIDGAMYSTTPRTSGSFHQSADTDSAGYFSTSTHYDGEAVPQFSAEAASELAAGLAELEKAHGICFGWSLTDGKTKRTQTGSSQGRDIAAKRCPRWLETAVTVGYTSNDSASSDGANIIVYGSSEFRNLPRPDDFARLGVNIPALLEDPIAGTGHAALGLPLLMIEAGILQPVAQAGQPITPKPLDAVNGSDISPTTWLVFYGLGGAAVLSVGLGFWLRKRAKDKERNSSV
ncbi:hypothetical protein [Kibdelosporangium aridum]|uniref:hypothetical protein n=1 Tax=Kibdelosporangium aridum TaxID=2030 RepID=UPI0006896D18|nr:hypothetical protein [Kibdelosporangium aridum]